nr:PREDICTED: basic salivary proline-rich protein 3-like [Linepithema humile]
MITCPVGEYAAVMKRAQEEIPLEDLGITEPSKSRLAQTGAMLMEVSGPERKEQRTEDGGDQDQRRGSLSHTRGFCPGGGRAGRMSPHRNKGGGHQNYGKGHQDRVSPLPPEGGHKNWESRPSPDKVVPLQSGTTGCTPPPVPQMPGEGACASQMPLGQHRPQQMLLPLWHRGARGESVHGTGPLRYMQCSRSPGLPPVGRPGVQGPEKRGKKVKEGTAQAPLPQPKKRKATAAAILPNWEGPCPPPDMECEPSPSVAIDDTMEVGLQE